jgi:hypothetical protein
MILSNFFIRLLNACYVSRQFETIILMDFKPLFQGGCESDLVAQDSANYIGLTNVDFNFNAFTFDAGADQLHLSCAVKLCATSGIGADLTTLETDCAQVETCSVTGDQAAAVSTTL